MNFTLDVKKEIISRALVLKRSKKEELAAKKAALSAFIRTSGELGIVDDQPTFFIVSETEKVAEFFMSLFFDVFGCELLVVSARKNRMSGRDKLLLRCPVTETKRVLKELGLLRDKGDGFKKWIPHALFGEEGAQIAYIKGAFLGGGSCMLPSDDGGGRYHLEFVFDERAIADEFCALLCDFELIAKCAERKEHFIVYIKSKEAICDFLAVVGAEKSLAKLESLMEKREESNNNNRAANCYASNMDKAAQAAVKQVVALEQLKNKAEFLELSDELKALAEARLQHPELSLQELADLLKVSKSCLNHRMRKLMSVAAKYEGEK